MNLLSLLFALTVERSSPAKIWQFSFYYQQLLATVRKFNLLKTPFDNLVVASLFLLLPTIVSIFIMAAAKGTIWQLVFSCAVLVVCLGCQYTRSIYKEYLLSAFRGEFTICEEKYQALLSEKNLPDIGLGQALIWLNYRYFIAVMLVFIFFGVPGVIFYRLLVAINDTQLTEEDIIDPQAQNIMQKLLFWLDWPLVRILSFCYMLVGHFSRALPTWLEGCFDFTKAPYLILTTVAKQAEDFQIAPNDCTAEPCTLVRLAKRSLLLILAVIAIFTIAGFIH